MSVATPDSPDGFQKADTLRNRTFIGLLIAQFLAAFNDQAIHASAMFFAINKKALTEEKAISLMPILFFAPWALFATLAGYLSDKYSKRYSLIFWKFSEIFITGLALFGFVLGSELNMPNAGVWIVLSTVFLMGTHSTFFVPAKYGAMPEILTDELMSKGNGLLEMLSFLATIFGTVMGGVLSLLFHDNEYVIGLILLGLAIIGAGASLMIQRMAPANPQRRFPRYVYLPLIDNLRILMRSRPLAFVLVGIAFFTFMLAFMRAAVYMLGESRIPRWNELETSAVVGMTALGIGLGSPMAGWLSGKKVELGLVPIGAIGMVLTIVLAALLLNATFALIVCIVLIGFFTGFYLVPLFTQQQHRAPKHMKGEVIATCNFTNVVGAIIASLLFFALVWVAHRLELAPRMDLQDVYIDHTLKQIYEDRFHHPQGIRLVAAPNAPEIPIGKQGPAGSDDGIDLFSGDPDAIDAQVLISQKAQVAWNEQLDAERDGAGPPQLPVTVSKYLITAGNKSIPHYYVRLVDEEQPVLYDNRNLPRYLFLGAAVMTLCVFLILMRMLPDLLQRTNYVLKSLGKPRLSVSGILHLPGHGAVILATNASTPKEGEDLWAACDRLMHFVHSPAELELAHDWLRRGQVVAISLSDPTLLEKARNEHKGELTILPSWVGPARVKFGHTLAGSASLEEIQTGLKQAEASDDH